ncbi:pr domain zinc finger protein 16 [Stylonychia lemnae]|uniref:Pr domain zinc finger protein 16 n=1 Tax=Stylonychia lemnae TaxID=5949 RepID=A0A078B2L9_STYLE|nr:pr domain zinc finger protein 16 [Stylonychia lemnae]|eukprot:CDW88785.1 pr domain zinc finger protein 16 [Stylonychia lemnae]
MIPYFQQPLIFQPLNPTQALNPYLTYLCSPILQQRQQQQLISQYQGTAVLSKSLDTAALSPEKLRMPQSQVFGSGEKSAFHRFVREDTPANKIKVIISPIKEENLFNRRYSFSTDNNTDNNRSNIEHSREHVYQEDQKIQLNIEHSWEHTNETKNEQCLQMQELAPGSTKIRIQRTDLITPRNLEFGCSEAKQSLQESINNIEKEQQSTIKHQQQQLQDKDQQHKWASSGQVFLDHSDYEIENEDDMDEDYEIEENQESLMQKLDDIGDSGRTNNNKHKTFEGIPKQWHQTIRVKNPETQRVKLYFKCRYPQCGSVFKKSCNLRDHFRKHTGLRPFKCPFCQKTFTQSGNLGRHLKNVHGVSRDSINLNAQNDE